MSPADTPRTTIAHYDIERVLGRGSMGIVYLARDRRIGRRVALKMISVKDEQFDDAEAPREFYARLQREAEVCGSLLHPNIVALYEVGYENDRISYLAMEYVEGENLLEMMKRIAPKPLGVEVAVPIIKDVMRGLAYAHEKGIVHRDIKPENVLIAAGGTAKITDFGIARAQNSSLTTAGALLGTPSYMSPEQVLGHTPTPKADIFSSGVMVFEMLTAGKPFAAPDLTGMLHSILRQPAQHVSDLNPAVPRATGDTIARMLAKKPEERPGASAILAALSAGDGADGVRSSIFSFFYPLKKKLKIEDLTPSTLRIAGAIGLVLVAAGVLVVTRPPKPQPAVTSTHPSTTSSVPRPPEKTAEVVPPPPAETMGPEKPEPKPATKKAQRRKPNWLRRIQRAFRH